MAIKSIETDEYIKVTGFQADFANGNLNIVYLKFANEEQRQRYESGLNPYEVYVMGQYNGYGTIVDALNQQINSNLTVNDCLFSACYTALKSDIFKDWIDC